MRKELSSFQKNLFVSIIGIFIVLVIFIIMNVTVGKHLREIQEENAQLEQEYETLKGYVEQLDSYKEDTATKTADITTLINRYEVTTTPQSVLHTFSGIEKELKVDSSSLSYQTPEEINTISFINDNVMQTYSLQKSDISVTYSSNYDTLMTYLSQLKNNLNNESITNISMASDDSTGKILGTITITKYTINSESREYTDPEIKVRLGATQVLRGNNTGTYTESVEDNSTETENTNSNAAEENTNSNAAEENTNNSTSKEETP